MGHIDRLNMNTKSEPRVMKTWLSGGNSKCIPKSVMLTIPAEYTKEYHQNFGEEAQLLAGLEPPTRK